MTNAILSALVNAAIAGSLVAVAVSVALLLVPRTVLSAAARYAVWWAAMAAVVILPAAYVPLLHTARAVAMPAAVSVSLPAPSAHLTSVPVQAPPPAARWRFPLIVKAGAWSRWVLPAWALVSALMLLRLVASCILLERRKARAATVDFPLDLARGVRVLSSSETGSPVLAGLWRPAILFPARLFQEMTAEELRQIALHEAAHLARRDDWAMLALRAVQALLPWHPAVWWMARRIDLERELACDAMVVARTGNARQYALCLVRVVELCGGARPLWAGAGVGSQLGTRVNRLLDGKVEARSGWRRVWTAVGLVAVLAFCLGRTPRAIALAEVQAPVPVAAPSPVATQAPPPLVVPVTLEHVQQDVAGFTKENFRIFDNAVEQPISGFSAERPPQTLELVVDRSGSMRDKDGLVDDAILQIVTANPQNEFLLVTFSDTVQISGPFGGDAAQILSQVHRRPLRGGTAIRDAILQALQWTGARYHDRTLVVISDGVDNASSATSDEILRAPIPRTLAITLASPETYPRPGSRWLGELARMHQGSELVSIDPIDVAQFAKSIAGVAYYRLQFNPANPASDRTFHKIRVALVNVGMQVNLKLRYRQGYFANSH